MIFLAFVLVSRYKRLNNDKSFTNLLKYQDTVLSHPSKLAFNLRKCSDLFERPNVDMTFFYSLKSVIAEFDSHMYHR